MNISDLRAAIDDALQPQRFFVAPGWRLRVEHVARETIAWEVFRGHLLDGSKTREQRSFEAWHVFLEPPSDTPLISLRFDEADHRLFVTRNILVHGWEAFEPTPAVIDSRPVQKWVAELMGTLNLDARPKKEEMAREIGTYLGQAVHGAGRLPIASHEAPLPACTLGRLAYLFSDVYSFAGCNQIGDLYARSGTCELHLDLPPLIEFVLHASPPIDMPRLAQAFLVDFQARRSRDSSLNALLWAFNNVSLTPLTGLISNLAGLLRLLANHAEIGPARIVAQLTSMLRLLTRHLTAYDLVQFHSFGANYPDALALDMLLKLWIELVEQSPALVLPDPADDQACSQNKRSYRRTLRQAWLLRKRYEGLRVPDAPTSMGENQRVLPEPFRRVADEQIVDPRQRRKVLFENEPAELLLRPGIEAVWRLCLIELEQPAELRELGTGLFLDRPLGIWKANGEVDRTPMFSYVAFSRSVAEIRLHDLHRWRCFTDEDACHRCLAALTHLPVRGWPAAQLPGAERPGVVTLEDTQRAASDFMFLYTTGISRRSFARRAGVRHRPQLAEQFAEWTFREQPALIIRTASAAEAACGRPFMTAFDRDLRPRWRLGAQVTRGQGPRYEEAFGEEFLADGLYVEEV